MVVNKREIAKVRHGVLVHRHAPLREYHNMIAILVTSLQIQSWSVVTTEITSLHTQYVCWLTATLLTVLWSYRHHHKS